MDEKPKMPISSDGGGTETPKDSVNDTTKTTETPTAPKVTQTTTPVTLQLATTSNPSLSVETTPAKATGTLLPCSEKQAVKEAQQVSLETTKEEQVNEPTSVECSSEGPRAPHSSPVNASSFSIASLVSSDKTTKNGETSQAVDVKETKSINSSQVVPPKPTTASADVKISLHPTENIVANTPAAQSKDSDSSSSSSSQTATSTTETGSVSLTSTTPEVVRTDAPSATTSDLTRKEVTLNVVSSSETAPIKPTGTPNDFSKSDHEFFVIDRASNNSTAMKPLEVTIPAESSSNDTTAPAATQSIELTQPHSIAPDVVVPTVVPLLKARDNTPVQKPQNAELVCQSAASAQQNNQVQAGVPNAEENEEESESEPAAEGEEEEEQENEQRSESTNVEVSPLQVLSGDEVAWQLQYTNTMMNQGNLHPNGGQQPMRQNHMQPHPQVYHQQVQHQQQSNQQQNHIQGYPQVYNQQAQHQYQQQQHIQQQNFEFQHQQGPAMQQPMPPHNNFYESPNQQQPSLPMPDNVAYFGQQQHPQMNPYHPMSQQYYGPRAPNPSQYPVQRPRRPQAHNQQAEYYRSFSQQQVPLRPPQYMPNPQPAFHPNYPQQQQHQNAYPHPAINPSMNAFPTPPSNNEHNGNQYPDVPTAHEVSQQPNNSGLYMNASGSTHQQPNGNQGMNGVSQPFNHPPFPPPQHHQSQPVQPDVPALPISSPMEENKRLREENAQLKRKIDKLTKDLECKDSLLQKEYMKETSNHLNLEFMIRKWREEEPPQKLRRSEN